MTDFDQIRAFLDAMRERHREQIDNVELPDGTFEYIQSLVDTGDTETMMFIIKLSYLMGLQTGFAVAQDSGDAPDLPDTTGPLKA